MTSPFPLKKTTEASDSPRKNDDALWRRHRLRPWKVLSASYPLFGETGESSLLRGVRAASPSSILEKPLPPQASVQVSSQLLTEFSQRSRAWSLPELEKSYGKLFQEIASAAGAAEQQFQPDADIFALTVEFFNSMANREFYPHLPSLLGNASSPAFGGQQIWLDLPFDSESREAVFHEAQNFWQQGLQVSFILDSAHRKYNYSLENFEGFVASVEQAILALPEEVEIPEAVGLYLSAENPWAIDFVRLAKSGKYYPRFVFSLALAPSLQKGLALSEKTQANQVLDILIQELDQSESVHYALSDASAACASHFGVPRLGGGPDLEASEICQLGSLNVAVCAQDSEMDWTKLRRMIRSAVHFLDNLLEVTQFPSEAVAKQSLGNRKIGLGIFGFSDLTQRLGLQFESPETQRLAERLMRFIHEETLRASMQLAQSRGCFPHYESSPWQARGKRVRNATLNAIVPDAFLAKLAGVAPGIEAKLSENANASWMSKLQSCFQKYCDGSVEILNQRENRDESTKALLKRAIEANLRHVYRRHAGAPLLSVIDFGEVAVSALEEPESLIVAEENAEIPPPPPAPVPEKKTNAATPKIAPRPSPSEALQATVRSIQTAQGVLRVTISYDESGPTELIAQLGKSGSESQAQAEALGRLVTLLFKMGADPRDIHEQLKDIRGPQVVQDQGEEVLSCADAVAKVLWREFRWDQSQDVGEGILGESANSNFLEDLEEESESVTREILH